MHVATIAFPTKRCLPSDQVMSLSTALSGRFQSNFETDAECVLNSMKQMFYRLLNTYLNIQSVHI